MHFKGITVLSVHMIEKLNTRRLLNHYRQVRTDIRNVFSKPRWYSYAIESGEFGTGLNYLVRFFIKELEYCVEISRFSWDEVREDLS